MSKQERGELGLPYGAGAHGASEQRLTGAIAELRAQQMDDAGSIRRLLHAARLGGVPGERLLAHDMASGGDRLQYDVHMCMGRRRHAHHVDSRELQRIGE